MTPTQPRPGLQGGGCPWGWSGGDKTLAAPAKPYGVRPRLIEDRKIHLPGHGTDVVGEKGRSCVPDADAKNLHARSSPLMLASEMAANALAKPGTPGARR